MSVFRIHSTCSSQYMYYSIGNHIHTLHRKF